MPCTTPSGRGGTGWHAAFSDRAAGRKKHGPGIPGPAYVVVGCRQKASMRVSSASSIEVALPTSNGSAPWPTTLWSLSG